MAKLAQKLPLKRRKDAVLAIEYLITASPEAMAKMTDTTQTAYFNDALKWLKDRHGKENVVFVGIHNDETTPHMYAYVVPLVNERLNCKHILGGARALNQMQTDFYQKVAKEHGLSRGIEQSKANHKEIKTFYKELQVTKQQIENIAINATEIAHKTLKKNFFSKTIETDENVANRLNTRLKPFLIKSAEYDKLKKENNELKKQNEELREIIKPLTDYGLHKIIAKKLINDLVQKLRVQQQEKQGRQREQQIEQQRFKREQRELDMNDIEIER